MAIAGGACSGVWIEHKAGYLKTTWHTGPRDKALPLRKAIRAVEAGERVFIQSKNYTAFDALWERRRAKT